jgi:N-acetylmuramoyl-L-alanine amidase
LSALVFLMVALLVLPAAFHASAAPAGQARAEGKKLRTVVIDPGHGGMELGAKGKLGHLEKDITLAIALKFKALVEKNMVFQVVLTRDKDIDVPVENRAAIANNVKADLFISIHTNGSRQKAAEGSETYFLSLGPTPDEETRRLAYLENNGARIEDHADKKSEDDVKMILWDMAQAAYIRQSSQLADLVQAELNALLGTRNRGIKQAPFKVLTGVACPAILIETAFISNPDEEKKLASEEFQTSVAEAIYRGLAQYVKLYP